MERQALLNTSHKTERIERNIFPIPGTPIYSTESPRGAKIRPSKDQEMSGPREARGVSGRRLLENPVPGVKEFSKDVSISSSSSGSGGSRREKWRDRENTDKGTQVDKEYNFVYMWNCLKLSIIISTSTPHNSPLTTGQTHRCSSLSVGHECSFVFRVQW